MGLPGDLFPVLGKLTELIIKLLQYKVTFNKGHFYINISRYKCIPTPGM